jgi:DNA polymerase-3 subunit delta
MPLSSFVRVACFRGSTMDALVFLDHPKFQRLFVVHGDEDFLRRLALQAIRTLVLGDSSSDDDLSYSTYPGETATFAAVMDELQTVPFFGDRRLIVVENADSFVTRNRAALEKAISSIPSTGVLVLSVKSWPSNTRLAKIVGDSSAIACKAPANYRLPQWCIRWSADRHQKQLVAEAAALLVELVGPEMGLLDQELLKLAIYVGDRKRIGIDDVDKLVGRGRSQDIWKIFDAIGTGKAREAMLILDRLLEQGEDAIRLLGAFTSQLRQAAKAYRLTLQGRPIGVALQEAGVPPFGIKQREQLLKHLGRRRLERIYDWMLETDLRMKGASQLPQRTLLERLVVRLAKTA